MKPQLLQKIAGLLAGFLYKAYTSTYRYEVDFEDPMDKRIFFEDLSTWEANPKTNLIYACFHQDDLSCMPYFAGHNVYVLISQSNDGQILASAVEYMGYKTVRGSSHRGGVAGLLALMRKALDGHKISIAVDGPKGPIYKVKEGITAVSEKARRPIVPLRGFPLHKHVFEKSWNKATLPLPFTRILIKIGKIGFYTTSELEKKMVSIGPVPGVWQ